MQSFLIIQTASIGDVILATPVIENLWEAHPGCRIDFLLKKDTREVLKGHPKITHLYSWNKSSKKYRNLFEIIKAVRRVRYDYVINIQRFTSSGIVTVLSGAKSTIGFNKNPFSFFFSKRIKHTIKSGNVHEVDRNLSLIASISDSKINRPKLYPSKSDFALVSQYKTVQYICVAPASLWFTKQFPEEKWVAFLSAINEQYQIYLMGSKDDRQLCQRIVGQLSSAKVLNLAGKLSLLQTAALMKDAHMNYMNDSAPQHLASAVNAKITAVFCSTVPGFGFGPLSNDSVVVETGEQLDCRPCGLHGFKQCPEKHFKCAYTINNDLLMSRL